MLRPVVSLSSAWACLPAQLRSLVSTCRTPSAMLSCLQHSWPGRQAAVFDVQDACRAFGSAACSLCCIASFSSLMTGQQSAGADRHRQVLRCLQDMSAECRRQQRADTLEVKPPQGAQNSHCPACAGLSRWVVMAAPKQLMLQRAASLRPLGPRPRPRAHDCSQQGLGQRRRPCTGLSCTTLSEAACCTCVRQQSVKTRLEEAALPCSARGIRHRCSAKATRRLICCIAHCDLWPHF